MTERIPSAARVRDYFRDPIGWVLDHLPWAVRRVYIRGHLGEWPPDECRLIGMRKPPARVFEHFRKLHGIEAGTPSEDTE